MPNFRRFCPFLAINQLTWRPLPQQPSAYNVDEHHEEEKAMLLAVASEDSSLRILSLKLQL